MKQGLKKTAFFLIAFFATTFLINLQKEPAFAHKVPTSITLNCAENAVAPLNNLKEIQELIDLGLSLSSAAKYLAKKNKLTKSLIYDLYLK